MARPRKSGMDYFPHDCDAATDEKIVALRGEYGNDGYTFFFVMCERIYRCENYELDLSHEEQRRTAAHHVGVPLKRFDAILNFSTSDWLAAFDPTAWKDRRCLTSDGIKKRAAVIEARRVPKPKKADNDTPTPHAAAPAESETGSGDAEPTGAKDKPESIDVAKRYAATIGLPAIECEKWFDYFTGNGWRTGKNTVKDWRATMRNWKRNAKNFANTNGKHAAPVLTDEERLKREKYDSMNQIIRQ